MTVVGPSVPDQTYENGVLAQSYDPVLHLLNVTQVTPASGVKVPNDENFVWSNVYDPASRTIRVVEV